MTTTAFVMPAVPGDLTLASTSDTGTKGNGVSIRPSLSADGAVVAFSSNATNLDPADTDFLQDVYVKDLRTDDLVLASTSDTGVKGNSHSRYPSLSADGTVVALESSATNLDPADTDGFADIYVKDLLTGELTLASTSDSGLTGNNHSFSPSLSADGAVVAFFSTATNLDPADTDFLQDVYVKDLLTGDLILASTSDTGVKGNSHSSYPSLSADGTVVAFESAATNLDPDDADLLEDVYVKDISTGNLKLASASDTGVKGNQESLDPSLSARGSKVAFYSSATNLDTGDTDTRTDIYVKNLRTGDIRLASTSDGGVKANRNSSAPSLLARGGKVAFISSATNLDPVDTDGIDDVYVKDLRSEDITLASTSDSGLKGNDNSRYPSLSADGSAVGFESFATNLDPADQFMDSDIYVKAL